tara:strand:- start:278 stop:448 length:171 start_codon:yes stop_codon:yes gene_type:complete
MDVIGHKMPFYYLTLTLATERMKNLTQLLAQMPIKQLATIFRDKYNMIFAFPFRMI